MTTHRLAAILAADVVGLPAARNRNVASDER
jgi:hypothetical protein